MEKSLQGKHTIVEVIEEVFSVTKLSNSIEKASTKNFAIRCEGFSGYVI